MAGYRNKYYYMALAKKRKVPREMTARYEGTCSHCGRATHPGESIIYLGATKELWHPACYRIVENQNDSEAQDATATKQPQASPTEAPMDPAQLPEIPEDSFMHKSNWTLAEMDGYRRACQECDRQIETGEPVYHHNSKNWTVHAACFRPMQLQARRDLWQPPAPEALPEPRPAEPTDRIITMRDALTGQASHNTNLDTGEITPAEPITWQSDAGNVSFDGERFTVEPPVAPPEPTPEAEPQAPEASTLARLELTSGSASIEAYSDLIITDESRNTVLLSILGSQSKADAIKSYFLNTNGRTSDLYATLPDGRGFFVRPNPTAHHNFRTSKLMDSAAHIVVADHRFLLTVGMEDKDRFILAPGQADEDEALLYAHLHHEIPTPLLPEWQPEVISQLFENWRAHGMNPDNPAAQARARQLTTRIGNRTAYHVKATEPAMDCLIKSLIQRHAIGF